MYPQIFGKYVLEREIAAGGMARVYLATLRGAVGFEKRLVVKQIRSELALDEAFVRRFVEEAKTAVELNHPNIVPVYELGVEQGVYYIAMELCRGLSLAELLEAGPFEPEQGAYVGAEICRALDYAHRRTGMVHRDVTPRNVMIDEEGAVRLIDFGIAAPSATDGADARQREVFGSPGHMPPEQIEGRPLTPAADVFAVATLLIEAWTGRPPFRRATLQASNEALKTAPPKLAEHDPRFAPISDVIERAVAIDPGHRPQDAESLGRRLREFTKTRDRGDLARELGERVRRLQHARSGRTSVAPPALPETSPLPRSAEQPEPIKPAHSRTFAVRDELVHWTRPVPTPAPELEPTTTPTEEAQRRSYRPRLTRGRLLIGAGLLATAGALPLFAGLLPSAPVARLGTVLPRVLAATPLPEPPPAPEEPVPSSPEPAPEAPAPPQALAKPPAPEAAPEPAKTAPVGKGVLSFSSDLPASVSVDGQSLGSAPRSVELGAGDHVVVFTTSGIEERVRTTLTLAAGVRLRVHADFSSATPRIVLR